MQFCCAALCEYIYEGALSNNGQNVNEDQALTLVTFSSDITNKGFEAVAVADTMSSKVLKLKKIHFGFCLSITHHRIQYDTIQCVRCLGKKLKKNHYFWGGHIG